MSQLFLFDTFDQPPKPVHLRAPRANPYSIEVKAMVMREIAPRQLADQPQAVFDYWQSIHPAAPWWDPAKEHMLAIHLNSRRRVIGHSYLSTGTLDTILVHPRDVFRDACVAASAALILLHNHPSGDPTPSEADIRITRELVRAGQLMKIELLDHIIAGRTTPDRTRPYISLREAGYFYN